MERIGVIVKNGVVANRIVWADHTGEQMLNDGYDHAEEVTDMEIRPGIGWTWNETDGYRTPQPFPSWTWDGVMWQPPVPKPEGEYLWNEETQTWDAIPTEEPAP